MRIGSARRHAAHSGEPAPGPESSSKWLKRIGEQVVQEIVVDRDAIDEEPFRADGGFQRLNKVFDGELEAVLADINEEIWKKAG